MRGVQLSGLQLGLRHRLDPRMALAKGGARLKWAKGRSGSKNDEKVKVLRMEFSIVENISGLQESIFSLSRGPQFHFAEKIQKNEFY